MTKRFGLGPEKESPNSPSVQQARAYFLKLILELKPGTALDICGTADSPFSELLSNNQNKIDSMCELEVSKWPKEDLIMCEPQGARKRATRNLIPDWASLREVEGASLLCRSLQDWAQTHNLTDDWCLDHAIAFLRAFHFGAAKINWRGLMSDTYVRDFYFRDVIRKAWEEALLERRNEAADKQYRTNAEFENLAPNLYSFNFEFENVKLSVSGPRWRSESEFRGEVKKKFDELGGRAVRGAKTALDIKIASYLEQVRKVGKEMELKQPPILKAEHHFEWLILWQVAPCLSFLKIAESKGCDWTVVRDGVYNAANLCGLKNLRPRRLLSGKPPSTLSRGIHRRAR